MVLIEPPPLLESVAGRKYHYPHTFHCRSEKLFRILKLHIYRSSNRSRGVWLLRLPRFYTACVINVPVKLIFNFQVAKRNDSFHRPLLLLATKSQNYRDLFFDFYHFQHFDQNPIYFLVHSLLRYAIIYGKFILTFSIPEKLKDNFPLIWLKFFHNLFQL